MSPVMFQVLGHPEPLKVVVCCVGEGPVINVSPGELDWGRCPVLTPYSKSVLLRNESLIPAHFECALVSTCDCIMCSMHAVHSITIYIVLCIPYNNYIVLLVRAVQYSAVQ